ncbi:UDP-N-acetylmuramate--L-alanine ligase [Candidatus Dependentiae bacterium Noda2021]|nr:UDP-N-acetylmuramate--L-alanine ligase [Candidatus Dependentiae bacterium Noda2021]
MYSKKAHIHFVGIGGIGMSGIATILKQQGYEISGCDQDTDQTSIINLKKLGCVVYEGNNTPHCQSSNIDILVYSSAIRHHNPEIVHAQERGIPTIPRALMLAELMRTKYSIAIAGSHGKTTTTSLISHILIESGIDPTVIIGGHLKNISHNARMGQGDFLVAEADESDKSIEKLHPTLALITNIDLEHLETYQNLDDIKTTFKKFLDNIPFYGKAFLCADDTQIQNLWADLTHIKKISYGIDNHADIYGTKIVLYEDYSTFEVIQTRTLTHLGTIHLNMPGKHNVLNALGAIAVSLDLGISFSNIQKALLSFNGIDRRFTYKGTFNGAEFYDDYGHHPIEIYNTLLVARKKSKNKLIVLFQPHRYSRTDKLWQHFIETFRNSTIDQLIITDIYPQAKLLSLK